MMNSDEWSQLAERTVCVIPVYNESKVLKSVLEEILAFFPNVICVDDGSTDNSYEISKSLGIRTIRHHLNIGQGGALQTGFVVVAIEGRFEYVVTMDSDGQHDPRDAVRMVVQLHSQGLDVMFASRFLSNRSYSMPISKRLVLRSAVMITRLASRSQLTDTHNGLRVLRHQVLNTIQLQQFGMAHATELVSRVLKSSFRIAEMPVEIRYTSYSRSKGQSILNSLNILLDLLWK